MTAIARSVLVTGASDGIGASAAAGLAQLGWRVAVSGRSEAKLTAVAERIGAVGVYPADFERLSDVRRLAADVRRDLGDLTAVAHNAGGVWPHKKITDDGFERTLQVDHLAPFLLQHELGMPGARVVLTSSAAHTTGRLSVKDPLGEHALYLSFPAYGRAKLLNVLMARGLAARGTEAVAFHPGVVGTSFGRDGLVTRVVYALGRRTFVTPEAAGACLVALLEAPRLESGGYYVGTAPARPSRYARDADLAEAAWARSVAALGL